MRARTASRSSPPRSAIASSTSLSGTTLSCSGARFAPGIRTTAISRLPIFRPAFHENEQRTRASGGAPVDRGALLLAAPLDGVAAHPGTAAVVIAAADE